MNDKQNLCANCDAALEPKEHGGYEYLVCKGCQYWWTDGKLDLCRRHMRQRPDCTLMSLVYEPNGTDHDDLVMGLASWRYRCDTYYYELDHPAGSDSDVPGTIRRMLEMWLQDLQRCSKGQSVYLPYDFSDQYTGWIKCALVSDIEWQITPGWSDKEGWAFDPSDYEDVAKGLDDFRPVKDGIQFVVESDALYADIALAIADAKKLGASGLHT
jgi:hypothetical protein